MRRAPGIGLADVRGLYSGPEGRLWELLMGEQIHLGGLQSSLELAERGGIAEGASGVDLCCANGAGMRFLLRFRKAASMVGVDATPNMIRLARERCAQEGFGDGRVSFVEADARNTGLPSNHFDFIWGEDAWCYVEDKAQLITEAVRLAKPAGTIAFTDWMEGQISMSEAEAGRYLRFMKFPSVLTLSEYRGLLESHGCSIRAAVATDRFINCMPLYLEMLEKQLTYDALKILGFDSATAQELLAEMRFVLELANAGKVVQGLIVASRGR